MRYVEQVSDALVAFDLDHFIPGQLAKRRKFCELVHARAIVDGEIDAKDRSRGIFRIWQRYVHSSRPLRNESSSTVCIGLAEAGP